MSRLKNSILKYIGFISMSLLFSVSSYSQIKLQPDGYFDANGFRFLIYQNTYLGGRFGGLEMILNGKRVLDAGNVICLTTDGKKYGYYDDGDDKRGEKIVDLKNAKVSYPVELQSLGLKYKVSVISNGKSINVRIDLNQPVDWEKINEFAFRIEIYPEEYDYKTFNGGGISDSFYEQHMGRRVLIPEAKKIDIAPEDPLRKMTFEGENVTLSLRDERRDLNVSGYMLFASLKKGSTEKSFSLKITPSINPDWTKDPIIQVSQVGYHSNQKKIAFLEVIPGTKNVHEMELQILNQNSELETVASIKPDKWGDLFQNTYYSYDFSFMKNPGQYFLIYDNQKVGPFKISPSVFQTAWQPTLDIYFPTQMCHVKVKDYLRLWHGACHLDDALQAPVARKGYDGYIQGPETQTAFSPNEHVPGINWGGWHDAGDFDLPTGSICETTLWMALAQEKFKTTRDVTTVLRNERLVELFKPDGKNDMLQQIAFGMEWLLSVVKQVGHVPAGIITHIGPDYGSAGDPGSITDGLLYDPKLGKTEQKNGFSGKFDDRWIYTDRNTGGQYQFVQIAAICSRLFQNVNDSLSTECLLLAERIWNYEQSNQAVSFPAAYNPQENKYHSLEMAAATELFLTTGTQKYREKLLTYIPTIKEMPVSDFNWTGFNLVRVKDKVNDINFTEALFEKAKEVRLNLQNELDKSPYNVVLQLGWGSNWSILKTAAQLFYFIDAYPDLFDPEILYSSVNFVLGAHPASNHSFVSGVGSKSATLVYGFNRADKSYQPGGVISGVTLIKPDFVEYRGRAWDWYQTEHVISGSSAYIFDILATDYLLNRK